MIFEELRRRALGRSKVEIGRVTDEGRAGEKGTGRDKWPTPDDNSDRKMAAFLFPPRCSRCVVRYRWLSSHHSPVPLSNLAFTGKLLLQF